MASTEPEESPYGSTATKLNATALKNDYRGRMGRTRVILGPFDVLFPYSGAIGMGILWTET